MQNLTALMSKFPVYMRAAAASSAYFPIVCSQRRQVFTLQARQALPGFRDFQYCWFSSSARPCLEAPGAKTMKHHLLLLEGEHQEPAGDGHRGPPASNANSRPSGLLEGAHRRGRRQGEGARGCKPTRTSQT